MLIDARAAKPEKRLVSPYPSLRLRMLLPSRRSRRLPFPFNASPAYFYLARNAIYELARLWRLSGEEILFPAYCSGVELEALLASGAKPRFYPVHTGMHIDANEIAALLSPQTRAVYLIHYLGFPGPVQHVAELCRKRGVLLIEDCALALLSRLGDKPLGTFGDAAVFCLYKTLPVPNGGALVAPDLDREKLAEAASPSLSSTLAYTGSAIWRHLAMEKGGPLWYMLRKARALVRSRAIALGIVPVGNLQFDRSQAHLAMSRMCLRVTAAQDFDSIVQRRRSNYLRLSERLRDLVPPFHACLPPGVCPLFYPLETFNKLYVAQRLLQRGVDTVDFWSPRPALIPLGAFPEVDCLRKTVLELPCHQNLSPDDVDWLADQVRSLRNDL
jgi:dTDP-4-amino-4,6-dideoxygalactose transaminase